MSCCHLHETITAGVKQTEVLLFVLPTSNGLDDSFHDILLYSAAVKCSNPFALLSILPFALCYSVWQRVLWAISHAAEIWTTSCINRFPVLWISFCNLSEIILFTRIILRGLSHCAKEFPVCTCIAFQRSELAAQPLFRNHIGHMSLYIRHWKDISGFFALNDLIVRYLSRKWHFCTEAMCKIPHNAWSIKTGQSYLLFSSPLASPQVCYFSLLALHLYRFLVSVSKFARIMEKKNL